MTSSRRVLLADLLDSPRLSVGLFSAGVAHLGLCASGVGGWPCPFYSATGWPCPGCGLGRACVLFLRGDWRHSLRVHAFAPLFLVTLLVLALGFILPGAAKIRLRGYLGWLEARTAFPQLALVALLVYWALRFRLDTFQPY